MSGVSELLREALETAWCDAAIGCSHPDPKRAAMFRDHFYDWQRRGRLALEELDGAERVHAPDASGSPGMNKAKAEGQS